MEAPPLQPNGRWTGSCRAAHARRRGGSWSIGRCRWTPRSTVPTSMAPTCPATRGDLSITRICLRSPTTMPWASPAAGWAPGSIPGRWEQAAPVILLGPGQGGDSPMFENLLESLKVAKPGPGRARTRRTGRWPTRPTPRGPSATTCGTAASSASSPKRRTKRPTANARDPPAAARSPTTGRVQAPQRRRTQLQHPQAVAFAGNPVRLTRPDLPRSRGPAGRRHLVQAIAALGDTP